MKRVILHGQLAEMAGQSEFMVDVKDARDAFCWLFAVMPQSKEIVKDGNWNVFYSDGDPDEEEFLSLDNHELDLQSSCKEIHLAPEVCGLGGNRGIVKTVIGVIILVVATVYSGGTLSAPLAAGIFGANVTYGSIAFLGAAIALSGIAQMLTPMPDMSALTQNDRNEADARPSFIFNGAVNIIEEGGAVPLIYGTHRSGSTVISSGVTIEQIAVTVPVTSAAPPPTTGTTGGTATAGSGAFKAAQQEQDDLP